MSDRNRKLKKQSAHRDKAVGTGYFASTHKNKNENRTVMSEKKIRSSEIAESKKMKTREPRVGKPQGFMLGNRTRTDRGREGYGNTINRLNYLYDWVDPAAGSKCVIEFSDPSFKSHYVLLVRLFLNDN